MESGCKSNTSRYGWLFIYPSAKYKRCTHSRSFPGCSVSLLIAPFMTATPSAPLKVNPKAVFLVHQILVKITQMDAKNKDHTKKRYKNEGKIQTTMLHLSSTFCRLWSFSRQLEDYTASSFQLDKRPRTHLVLNITTCAQRLVPISVLEQSSPSCPAKTKTLVPDLQRT